MRNDEHDEINELPSLSAARHEPSFKAASRPEPAALSAIPSAQTVDHVAQPSKAVGVLSALTLALLCAGGTFAWWSMQRIELLEQQLVATQDSFSRISEDAAGRIKDITGKFTATESSVLGDNEILKMRLNKIESAAVDVAKQQQIILTEHTSRLTKTQSELASLQSTINRLSREQKLSIEQQNSSLNSLQKELKTGLSEHSQQLSSLTKSHQDSQQQMAQLAEQKQDFKRLNQQLLALQKSSGSKDDLTRLQQDILILRSELEQRPAAATASNQGPSLNDFDAYRAQTNRTINTLQEQVRNLQKNAQ